jgi:Holliday junction resolvase RusA-like endonuclease
VAPLKTAAFTVEGTPAPKGSRTAGVTKAGKPYLRPASKREKPWTELVSKAAALEVPLPPPYEIEIRFRFASAAKPVHPYPSRSDLDKLVRCAVDGLMFGGLIEDDRHVTRLVASKEYGTEGAVFYVRSLA